MKSEESVKHTSPSKWKKTLKWKRTQPRQISLLRKGRFPHNCLNIKLEYCILMHPKYLLAYFAFLPWRTLLLRWPVVSTRRLAVAPRWVWCKDQWWASVALPILLLSLSVLLYYMLIRTCDGPSSQVPGWTEKNMTGRKQELVAFIRRQMSFEMPGRTDQIHEGGSNPYGSSGVCCLMVPPLLMLMFAHYSLCTRPTRSA